MQVISWFLSIPLPLRFALLFLAGACLGAAVNLGIYRLAYLRRRISPWSYTRGIVPPRNWLDRIPIVGWPGLARSIGARPRFLDSADAHRTGFRARLALAVLVGNPTTSLDGVPRRAEFGNARLERHGRAACRIRRSCCPPGALGGRYIHRFRRTDDPRCHYGSRHAAGVRDRRTVPCGSAAVARAKSAERGSSVS